VKKGVYYSFIFVMLFSFFAFGDSKDIGTISEELLMKRAEAWNNILSEDYSYSDFYNEISSVATAELLVEDLETFSYLKENPTGMERVKSLELLPEKIEKQKNKAIVKGKIIWNMEGYEGTEVVESHYQIALEKYNRNWYIAELEPIE